MNNLLLQKCYNHKLREAVARCPECKRYFCRECITEHDDRLLCSQCLENIKVASETNLPALSVLYHACGFISGTILLWVAFYYIGVMLLSLPGTFHDGGIWTGGRMGE